MLSKYYDFAVVNNSGQTLDYAAGGRINLKVTPFYIDSSTGKVTFGTTVEDDCGFDGTDTLADGAEVTSSQIDNSSNLYTGAQVQLEITHDEGTAADDGQFDIYLGRGDTSGELPSDAGAYSEAEAGNMTYVGALVWHSDTIDDDTIRSRVFIIE